MSRRKKYGFGTTIITSGEYRGKTIMTPGGDTHPMGSREKLALFNMIADYVPYAFVCDAFAGSGALGIEALSRGAALVTFIDRDPVAAQVIEDNLCELEISDFEGVVTCADIVAGALTATDRFSMVLADPPYDEYEPEMLMAVSNLVALGGLLVASTPEEAPKLKGLKVLKRKKYARAHITVYERLGPDGEHIEYPRMDGNSRVSFQPFPLYC